MCVYSQQYDAVDAEVGIKPRITTFGFGGKWFGVRKPGPRGGRGRTCPVCFPNDTTLLFSKIPVKMQKSYGFGPEERAIVREGRMLRNGFNIGFGTSNIARSDKFAFRTGDLLDVSQLPRTLGVEVLALEALPLIEELQEPEQIPVAPIKTREPVPSSPDILNWSASRQRLLLSSFFKCLYPWSTISIQSTPQMVNLIRLRFFLFD